MAGHDKCEAISTTSEPSLRHGVSFLEPIDSNSYSARNFVTAEAKHDILQRGTPKATILSANTESDKVTTEVASIVAENLTTTVPIHLNSLAEAQYVGKSYEIVPTTLSSNDITNNAILLLVQCEASNNVLDKEGTLTLTVMMDALPQAYALINSISISLLFILHFLAELLFAQLFLLRMTRPSQLVHQGYRSVSKGRMVHKIVLQHCKECVCVHILTVVSGMSTDDLDAIRDKGGIDMLPKEPVVLESKIH